MLHLNAHSICCHLGGSFMSYIAQIFNSYASIHLYVTLGDSPLQNLLFQAWGRGNIHARRIRIRALDHHVESDIVLYAITYGEFKFLLNVWGIVSVEPCGHEWNVDYVHFVCDNSDDFSFLNNSITILPSSDPSCSRPQAL